jgi:hypothetical protein
MAPTPRSIRTGLAAGALVLTGVMSPFGTALASAQASSACSQIEATLNSIQKELPQAAGSSALASKIGGFVVQLETEAATAPANVKSAVGAFVTELKSVASGKVNVPLLTADANAIGKACTTSAAAVAPKGAPATGAGTTAGFQDLWLVFGGAGAVVAGAGLSAFALLRRRANKAC